jgi:hypothetical protein
MMRIGIHSMSGSTIAAGAQERLVCLKAHHLLAAEMSGAL